MEKTLSNTSIEEAKQQVSDIQHVGNGNQFKVLSKAWSKSEGWMKSTKAMEIPRVGCLVQVTTQQTNQNGSSVAEALIFVPGVVIADDENGGRKLVAG